MRSIRFAAWWRCGNACRKPRLCVPESAVRVLRRHDVCGRVSKLLRPGGAGLHELLLCPGRQLLHGRRPRARLARRGARLVQAARRARVARRTAATPAVTRRRMLDLHRFLHAANVLPSGRAIGGDDDLPAGGELRSVDRLRADRLSAGDSFPAPNHSMPATRAIKRVTHRRATTRRSRMLPRRPRATPARVARRSSRRRPHRHRPPPARRANRPRPGRRRPRAIRPT